MRKMYQELLLITLLLEPFARSTFYSQIHETLFGFFAMTSSSLSM